LLVKDESMIGKKIDCPKCKYRFVVEDPNGKDKAAPSKKPAAVATKTGPVAKGAPPAKAAAKTKPAAKAPADDEDEDEEEDRPKKKKKKGGSNKMVLGLALAGVGVIVLAVGGFLLFGNKGSSAKKAPSGGGARPDLVQNANQGNANEQPGEGKGPKKKPGPEQPVVPPVAVPAAGPELTNLLPAQAQHVLHVFVKDVLDPSTLLGEAAFQPGALNDEDFKQRLGFSLKAVDDLIRAENYSKSWAFTLVHLKEAVEEKALTEALGLEPAAGSPLNGQTFFKMAKTNPWIEELARVSLGTLPPPLIAPAKSADRPLFVRIHNPYTLVFADVAPMQEFLARGMPASGPAEAAKTADQSPMPAEIAAAAPGETYTTLKPALKAMLDKLEKLPPDSADRVLFSAVTDLEAARIDAPPGRVGWRFRPIWDVAHALLEDPQSARLLGASLIRKGKSEPAAYRYLNEIECASTADGRSVGKGLEEMVAPDVARFFEMLLGLKVEVPEGEGMEQPGTPMTPNPPPQATPPPNIPGGPPRIPGGPPRIPGGPPRTPGRGQRIPGAPPRFPGSRPPGPGSRPPGPGGPPQQPPMGQITKEPRKRDPNGSQITVANADKSVVFTLDLVLNEKALPRLGAIAELLMIGVRGQLELASGASHRTDLALAEKRLGEQGIPDRGVPAAHYPRGVFARKDAAARSARDPGQGISWMAGLLPLLGHESLYARIKFDASWKAPANWMPAHTLVPEFLDPRYPDWARFAPYPGIPFPLGGTHFVGIAGVGQDAPDYAAGDPAVVAKLGVFGYDRMTSLEEIKKNRGLSITAVMVQVPYNGAAGVTPWMAGGGSTLRGVPEKDSVKPFVSTTNDGKRGTMLLMADGSVRFVAEDVKDDVFKALCTIKGPAEAASLDRDAPVVQGAQQAASAPKEDRSKETAPKADAPSGWKEFTSQEGRFSVLLPGTPSLTQLPTPAPDKVGNTTMLTIPVPGKKLALVVVFADLPSGELKSGVDKALRNMKAGFLDQVKGTGTLKKETKITLGKHPGLQLEMEVPGQGASVTKFYIVGGRVYTLMAAGADPAADALETRTFFDSFKLLPGAEGKAPAK